MNDSTKRALRTFVQAVIGVAAAVAVAVPLLPPGTGRYAAVVAGAATVAALIAKIWAALQLSGKLPPWLLDDGKLGEAKYAEAWSAGHRAATDEQRARDVTQAVRPVSPAEVSSRRAQLDDEPGRHSPDRNGDVPTSVRARQTGAWSAAASVQRPRPEGWPEIDPAAKRREIDEQGPNTGDIDPLP